MAVLNRIRLLTLAWGFTCFMVNDVVATLIVDIGSCAPTAGFTGDDTICALFPSIPDIIVSMDMAAWMFLHTTQCLVSGGAPYASVYGALRGPYMAEDLSFCICLYVHEVLLVMSPIIQATGRRIVHNWVWLHLADRAR